jgi:mRNA-degrading endonuclease RelE of RelBE toxin-antitoxin system
MKDLAALPAKSQDAIEAQVSRLESNWTGLDIVALRGTDLWRLRVSSYRVFFRLDQEGRIQLVVVLQVSRRTTTTYR